MTNEGKNMSDSIRQQLISAIDTRLKTITTANGYKTNAGSNVFDWLDRDLADSELDAIIYRDRSNVMDMSDFDSKMNTVVVEIQVKTKSTTTTAAQVREMIEDVYKAIGTDETWGGLALQTMPKSDDIDVQQSDKITGSGTITIEIQYESAKWSY
jgi:hypothetical protein